VADGIVVFNRDFAISGFTVTGVRIAPRAFRSMHVVSTSPVLFRDKISYVRSTVSDAVKRAHALVGTNGDFFTAGLRPLGAFASHGRLIRTGDRTARF